MDIKLLNRGRKGRASASASRSRSNYLRLSDDEMDARIAAAKRTLGDRLVILGHHYQRDEVIKFADFTGDSLKLARAAASTGQGRVHRLLRRPLHGGERRHPPRAAPEGHPARPRRRLLDGRHGRRRPTRHVLARAGARWASTTRRAASIIPVTYINSSAAIKAFVRRARRHRLHLDERGGDHDVGVGARREARSCCPTSISAATPPSRWAFRSTEMVVWDPNESRGGLEPEQVKTAKLILWKGHCSVHTRFTVAQIDAFRKKYPDGKVIAHPECTFDVVQAADVSGSTEHIIKTVKNSPSGSIWAVATEIHLVNRLAHEVAPDQTVVTLDPFGCLCSTMFRVSPNHLLWVLEGLVERRDPQPDHRPGRQKRFAKPRARSDADDQELAVQLPAASCQLSMLRVAECAMLDS